MVHAPAESPNCTQACRQFLKLSSDYQAGAACLCRLALQSLLKGCNACVGAVQLRLQVIGICSAIDTDRATLSESQRPCLVTCSAAWALCM